MSKEEFTNRLKLNKDERDVIVRLQHGMKIFTSRDSVDEAIEFLGEADLWEHFLRAANDDEDSDVSSRWRSAFGHSSSKKLDKETVLQLVKTSI